MQKIVLASGNAGKLIELQQILAQKEISLLPQAEFAVGDVKETGLSFVENRSEEHTSELQSRRNLVCRLLPEKNNTPPTPPPSPP